MHKNHCAYTSSKINKMGLLNNSNCSYLKKKTISEYIFFPPVNFSFISEYYELDFPHSYNAWHCSTFHFIYTAKGFCTLPTNNETQCNVPEDSIPEDLANIQCVLIKSLQGA